MKRILSLALVLVLLAAVCLTGCTKTPASSAAPASSARPGQTDQFAKGVGEGQRNARKKCSDYDGRIYDHSGF